MSLTVDQFKALYSDNGRYINNGGIQCVAVPNQFNAKVVEGGWIGTPITGYASDWWTNWGNDVDYNNYVRVYPDQPAQKGDIAIWKLYPGIGLPHIAVVLANKANSLTCISQNPGPARTVDLEKKGLLGYLRPKKFIQAESGRINVTGTATVVVNDLNVRNDPSTNGPVVAQYDTGMTFNFDSYIIANGYVWLSYVSTSGVRRYVAQRSDSTFYVTGGVSK